MPSTVPADAAPPTRRDLVLTLALVALVLGFVQVVFVGL
jgi:hypothetical protein